YVLDYPVPKHSGVVLVKPTKCIDPMRVVSPGLCRMRSAVWIVESFLLAPEVALNRIVVGPKAPSAPGDLEDQRIRVLPSRRRRGARIFPEQVLKSADGLIWLERANLVEQIDHRDQQAGREFPAFEGQ